MINEEDKKDIKSVLNEQFDLINRLEKFGCQSVMSQSLCYEIKDCNKIIMEIIEGPKGGIEKMIERTS
jgi:hypothetical protein